MRGCAVSAALTADATELAHLLRVAGLAIYADVVDALPAFRLTEWPTVLERVVRGCAAAERSRGLVMPRDPLAMAARRAELLLMRVA